MKFQFRNKIAKEKPEEGYEKEFYAYRRDYLKARQFMEKFLIKHLDGCCYNTEDEYCEHCGSCKAYKHLDLIYDNPFAE